MTVISASPIFHFDLIFSIFLLPYIPKIRFFGLYLYPQKPLTYANYWHNICGSNISFREFIARAKPQRSPKAMPDTLLAAGMPIRHVQYALNGSICSTLSICSYPKRCCDSLDEVWSDAPLLQVRTLHAPGSPDTKDA
jgi:hypothetical protein